MTADNIEAEVFGKLTELDESCLDSVCAILELTVDERKKGNRSYLLKLILKHLNSDDIQKSQDERLSTFLKLGDMLDRNMNTPQKKPEVKTETVDTKIENFEQKLQDTHSFDFKKLKDFKISGTIGGPGEKDKLSYSSLSYQIQSGIAMGFSSQDICSGVIKAISPSSNLRVYLENRQNLTVEALIGILRSHFKEKDSTSTFTELCNASQYQNETCPEFVVRLMCLRQKVYNLAIEEGCPYEVKLLKKRFLHALETGIRNGNIRNELRPYITNNLEITDEELLELVTLAVRNESERAEKFSNKRNVNTFAIENDQQKDNSLLKQMQDLQCSHDKQINSVKCELQEIRKAIQNSNQSFHKKNTSLPPLMSQNTSDGFNKNVFHPPVNYQQNFNQYLPRHNQLEILFILNLTK